MALENPPLLIVSDMVRFRIRTNWTNSVSRTHEFELDDLADAATRDRLKWAFSDPERLRPGETRQSLTERVAASFASVAQALRERGHDPQVVAHFVNRLLRARLSDAFDRFLEGVADNRQVAFDDDGWRLKTDAAEQPDPAQSDSLAELHRWLDARSRTIRLADLLIEVENDLGFSVHFQQPGEKRVDPGEVCALLAAILAHGCNLGLYTMEKVAPDIAYRRLKVR